MNRISPDNDGHNPQGEKKLSAIEQQIVIMKDRYAKFAEVMDKAALRTAFFLGMSDDASYSYKRYEEKVFRDKIVQTQAEEHLDKDRLYFWIKQSNLYEVKQRLAMNSFLIDERDCAGATPIHAAYLFEQYEIAHWLVERYPEQALRPYCDYINDSIYEEIVEPLPESRKQKELERLKKMMPYTGTVIRYYYCF